MVGRLTDDLPPALPAAAAVRRRTLRAPNARSTAPRPRPAAAAAAAAAAAYNAEGVVVGEAAALEALTVVRLRALCAERGLPRGGRKQELVDRLRAAGAA